MENTWKKESNFHYDILETNLIRVQLPRDIFQNRLKCDVYINEINVESWPATLPRDYIVELKFQN